MKNELLVAQFAAQAKPDQTGRRRDLVFYSGAEIDRWDYWSGEPYTIQFSMKDSDHDFSRLKLAPLLKDHASYSVDAQVGHVESPRIENGVAMATAVFAETPDVDDLWAKIEAGHVRNVSMGVSIERLELISKPKEPKRYMAFGWAPYEISVVPIGADPAASFVFSERGRDSGLPAELREFVRGLYKEHLAKTGAAGEADMDRQSAIAKLKLRARGWSA